MNSKEQNMQFWNGVCKTNPAETKTVEYPFKHTAIGAMFQIKHATEQWGMMGVNWGVKDEKFTPIFLETEEKGFLIYNATLFYPKYYVDTEDDTPTHCFGEIPIHADINFYNKTKNGFKVENDITKKVATDALTKGLSKLGFNADVFEGLFDDNKYVQQMKQEFANPQENKPEKPKGVISKALPAIKSATDLKALQTLESFIDKNSWTEDELKELDLAISAKKGDFK